MNYLNNQFSPKEKDKTKKLTTKDKKKKFFGQMKDFHMNLLLYSF